MFIFSSCFPTVTIMLVYITGNHRESNILHSEKYTVLLLALATIYYGIIKWLEVKRVNVILIHIVWMVVNDFKQNLSLFTTVTLYLNVKYLFELEDVSRCTVSIQSRWIIGCDRDDNNNVYDSIVIFLNSMVFLNNNIILFVELE